MRGVATGFMNHVCRFLLLAVVLLSAVGCADHSILGQSEKYEFSASVVRGEGFAHRVLAKPGAGSILHVYLEGDGRPWLGSSRISADPTPERLLMPQLMALDPAPSIYLGRPCYFKLADGKCGPQWWTDKRYSQEVVRSLQAALDNFTHDYFARDYNAVVFIGHSGGGTLAMLLAADRQDAVGVVTLAGNLDTDRWTAHHNYTPLRGSLNPARQPPLADTIVQRHYLGDGDDTITSDMILPTIARQADAHFYMLNNIDHNCCWQTVWPQILEQMANDGPHVQNSAANVKMF